MNKDNIDQGTKNDKHDAIHKTKNIEHDPQNPTDDKKLFKTELNRKN